MKYFFCRSIFLFSAFWKHFPALSPSEPALNVQLPWMMTLNPQAVFGPALTAQSLSGEQIHGRVSWCDQCTGMREECSASPHSTENTTEPLLWAPTVSPTMSCVWGRGRHGRAVLWQGMLDLSSFPSAVPTSCWGPSPYTCLDLTPQYRMGRVVTPSAPIKHETALSFSWLNPLLAADLMAGWRGNNNNFVLISS